MAIEQPTVELVGKWLAPVLLDAALKGIAILALTSLAILLMRKASAAARHLVWFMGASSLLLLPILSATLPAWHILPTWSSARAPSTPQAPALSAATPPANPLPAGAEQPHPLALGEGLGRGSTASDLTQTASPPAAPETHHATPSAPSPQSRSGEIRSIASWLLLVWLLGVLLLLARLALALLSLGRLQRRSFPLATGQVPALAEQLRHQLNIHRPVHLLTSPQRTVPMTWGLFRARLLVPADCQWTPDQLRAVLLHELAHTKRWDCLTQSLVQLACALYWFNPLIWLAWHRIQIERERACDDLVLATGAKPSAYAQQLLHIASEMPATHLSAAAIAMARPGTLEGRLRAILDTTRNRRALTGVAIALCILALLAAIIPLASLRAAGPAIVSGQPGGDALDIRLVGVIPDGGDDVMSADGRKLGDELAAFTLSPYSDSYWGPTQRRRTFIFELPPSPEPITLSFTRLSVAGESHGLSSSQHPLLLEHKGRRYLSLSTTFPRTRRTQLAGMIDRDIPFDAIDLTLCYFVGAPGKAIFSVRGPLELGVPVLADAATQTTVTLTQDRPIYSKFHLSSKQHFDAPVIAYDKQGHRHLLFTGNGSRGSSGTEMEYDLGDLSPSEITLLTFGETPRERVFQNIKVSYANRPPTDYAPYLDQMAGRLGTAGLSGEQRASYDLSDRPKESLAVVDVVRGLHLYHAVNALHGTDFSKLSAEDQARARGAANRLVQSPFSQVRGLALQLGLRGSWPEFVDPAIEFVRGSDPERSGVAQALGNYTPQLSADQLGRIKDILLGAEDRKTLWSLWRCFALRRDEPPAVEAMVAFAQSPKTWLWWMAIPELGQSKAGRDHITQLAGLSAELRRRVLLRADTIPGTADADLNDARTLLPDLLKPSLQRVNLAVFSEVLRSTVEHRDQRANTELFVQYLGQLLSEWDLSRIPGMADDNWWAVDRMVKYINLWHGVNIGSLGTDVSQETRAIHETDWKAIAADAIRWHAARVQERPTTDSADNTDRAKPSAGESAQSAVEPLRPAASGTATQAANSQWRVKLPSGVTVELLGVTEHSRQERPWWRPDGSPLAQAPDHTPKRSEVPEIAPPAYCFPLLVSGIPRGETDQTIARITPQDTAGGNGLTQVTWKGIVPLPKGYRGPLPAAEDIVYTLIKSFPATVDRAAIEFGVPGGEWKTIARNARNDDKWPDYLTHRGADGPNVDVSFGQPYMAKFGQWNLSTVRVSVSHNIPVDRQARVVAVLADGTELAGQANTTDGHIQQIPETFSRYRGLGEPRQRDMLRTEDIKEFRLQTRPFQWVRFDNIALRPRPASATQPAAPRQ